MSLREQIETAVGRHLEVVSEDFIREKLNISGKDWRAKLDRLTLKVDFREGRTDIGPHGILLMSHRQGGVFLEFLKPAKRALTDMTQREYTQAEAPTQHESIPSG